MATTDRSKRSTFITDSTSSMLEARYLCGESMSKKNLLKSIVRLALADLSASTEKLRTGAMKYILSAEFRADCATLNLCYSEILEEVNGTISLKQNQKRAIIKKLIKKIEV